MAPYFDDGQVTLFCADVRDVDLRDVAGAVVTSPPYSVGLAYAGSDQPAGRTALGVASRRRRSARADKSS
jgi:predicted RNA methylase